MNQQTRNELILVIVNVLLGALLFGLVVVGVEQESPFWLWLTGGLLGLFWVALLALALALARAKTAAVLIVITALLAVLFGRAQISALGAAVMLVMTMSYTRARLAVRVNSSKKYSTYRSFWPAARWLVTGMTVALAALTWPALVGVSIEGYITADGIRPLVVVAQPLLANVGGGISAQETVDEIIEQQLILNGVEPVAEKEFINQQKQMVIGKLSQQLGQPVAGGDDLAAITARFLNNQIGSLTTRNPLLAAVVGLLVLAVIIRFLLPFLAGLVVVIIAGCIWCLLGLDFVCLKKVEEYVEVLSLSSEH